MKYEAMKGYGGVGKYLHAFVNLVSGSEHKTVIIPGATNSSETWVLTGKDENNLRIFERQIIRKISGPVILTIYGE